ncbi:hypothetical protein J14TS5_41620 [Paenibacillus lautus]|nr:hypothetical protein J14TS5_41620 [Paenibacillus lautus]
MIGKYGEDLWNKLLEKEHRTNGSWVDTGRSHHSERYFDWIAQFR